MKQLTHENNFIYLCLSLIVLLFSGAVIQEFPDTFGGSVFSIITLLMLLASIKSLHTDMPWRRTVYVLIVLILLLEIISKVLVIEYSRYLNLLILLIFFIHSFVVGSKQILFQGKADLNIIIGSLSLYLLLGLIWSIFYLFLLEIDPSALSNIVATNWQERFSTVTYYSFVTLTTLGYGDILPTNTLSQFFATMESIVGVFYMAIIVASLINTHELKQDNKPTPMDKK